MLDQSDVAPDDPAASTLNEGLLAERGSTPMRFRVCARNIFGSRGVSAQRHGQHRANSLVLTIAQQ